MNYLIDTHILLWAVSEPKKLSKSVRILLEEPNNTIYFSAASIWEINIKVAKNKLTLQTSITKIATYKDFKCLDIKLTHVQKLPHLPLIHSDPFDRIIIAQALVENMTLISSDRVVNSYPGIIAR